MVATLTDTEAYTRSVRLRMRPDWGGGALPRRANGCAPCGAPPSRPH